MNNEPVAWAYIKDGEFWDAIHPDEHAKEEGSYTIPLYTHPANPYQSITDTKIEPTVVSYTHPVKELTDEEIEGWITEWAKDLYGTLYLEPTDHQRTMAIKMARAILKKARE